MDEHDARPLLAPDDVPLTAAPKPDRASPYAAPWDMPRFRNWIAVAKVCALVQRDIGAGLAPLNLKLPQYDILANVFRQPGLTQQELANKLVVGRSNLSMLLPELEKRGLIRREADPVDKRLRRLTLTDRGRALTEQALQVQVAAIEDMMQVVSPEECDLIGDQMRRIATHIVERRARAGFTRDDD